ncbi:MAG: right-handed parallel beta-helix repeat-containing protein, partial [Myxococcota bacterium]|nr:right-handed parallel beta-helix repeat-containing protein [Myxococcota bacterium]
MKTAILGASLLGLMGCPGNDDTTRTTCAAGEILDGESCVPEACGTGTWGDLQTGSDTIYVNATAEEGGDGSIDHPLLSIQEAMDLADEQNADQVLVAAGTYPENLALNRDHSRIDLLGRCPDLVVLDASEANGPALDVAGGSATTDFTVAGLTIQGGYIGIYHWKGTLHLSRARIVDNVMFGLIADYTTLTEITDVEIVGTRCDEDGYWGRGIQGQFGSRIVLKDSTLTENRTTGFYLWEAEAELTDVIIERTLPDDKERDGEAIYIEEGSTITAERVTMTDNHKAAVFLVESTGTLRDSTILDTIADESEGFGSGLAAQDDCVLTIEDTWVSGSQMLGVFLDSVTASVDGLVIEETLPDPDGNYGRGLNVQNSVLDATDVQVRNAFQAGVFIASSSAVLDAVTVESVLHKGADASGLSVSEGSTVTVSNTRIQDVEGTGVIINDSAAVVNGLYVRDIHPDQEGNFGYGVQANWLTELTGRDLDIRNTHRLGLLVADYSSAELQDVRVHNVRRGYVDPFSYGIAVEQQSSLDLWKATVETSYGAGIAIIDSSDLTIHESEVRDTRRTV